ncbi:WG repeat-containing protein [Pseudoflavitalea rhizosphaerae]|uniref:WG repeat-containing protein n=1 Tax=Pseudoflavitalea rhizosphaerae TaxID=1884793 RepID=UPI000F8F66ED|nr:WG repeat-containing protein [Pseudoflavitalea rhizosphaerae]
MHHVRGMNSAAYGMIRAMNEERRYGFLDLNGKPVIPFDYTKAGTISRGLIPVAKNDKWDYIDLSGKPVVPFQYRTAFSFKLNTPLALIQSATGKYGLIDTAGREVLIPQFDEIQFFREIAMIIVVRNDRKRKFYNCKTMQPKSEHKYDKTSSFNAGYMRVRSADKYGFVNTAGEETVPVKYEDAETFFSETGLAAVKHKGKWGLIDNKNNVVAPFKYDSIKWPRESFYPASRKGKWGYLNSK